VPADRGDVRTAAGRDVGDHPPITPTRAIREADTFRNPAERQVYSQAPAHKKSLWGAGGGGLSGRERGLSARGRCAQPTRHPPGGACPGLCGSTLCGVGHRELHTRGGRRSTVPTLYVPGIGSIGALVAPGPLQNSRSEPRGRLTDLD